MVSVLVMSATSCTEGIATHYRLGLLSLLYSSSHPCCRAVLSLYDREERNGGRGKWGCVVKETGTHAPVPVMG